MPRRQFDVAANKILSSPLVGSVSILPDIFTRSTLAHDGRKETYIQEALFWFINACDFIIDRITALGDQDTLVQGGFMAKELSGNGLGDHHGVGIRERFFGSALDKL